MSARRRRPALWIVAVVAFFGCTKAETPATAPAKAPTPTPRPAAKPSAETAADLVGRAERAAGSGNLAAADMLLDQALAASPADRKALWLTVQVARRQSDVTPKPSNLPLYLKAASTFRKLRAAYPGLTSDETAALPVVLYNEACALSLSGEAPRAIRSLGEAFEAGFEDAERVEDDPDLDPIRPLPQFRALFDRFEHAYARATLDRQLSHAFPFDFRLPDPDGKPVPLADVLGKVTVVVVWGTWCAPGRKVVANLADLDRRDRKTGLSVVGLNYEIDPGGPGRKAARDYAKQAGLPFPCLVGDQATLDQIPDFSGYPTLLFLDASGTVRARVQGYLSTPAISALTGALLDETGPNSARK